MGKKTAKEHVPVSQTENDGSNKLQHESSESTNMNVDQSDKDDGEVEGDTDLAEIPENPVEKIGDEKQVDKDDNEGEEDTDIAKIPEDPSDKARDEEQLDSDHSNDAEPTEMDESKADDQDDNPGTVEKSTSSTSHLPTDSHNKYQKQKTKRYKQLVKKRQQPPAKNTRSRTQNDSDNRGRGKVLNKTLARNCNRAKQDTEDITYKQYLDDQKFGFTPERQPLTLLGAVDL